MDEKLSENRRTLVKQATKASQENIAAFEKRLEALEAATKEKDKDIAKFKEACNRYAKYFKYIAENIRKTNSAGVQSQLETELGGMLRESAIFRRRRLVERLDRR